MTVYLGTMVAAWLVEVGERRLDYERPRERGEL